MFSGIGFAENFGQQPETGATPNVLGTVGGHTDAPNLPKNQRGSGVEPAPSQEEIGGLIALASILDLTRVVSEICKDACCATESVWHGEIGCHSCAEDNWKGRRLLSEIYRGTAEITASTAR